METLPESAGLNHMSIAPCQDWPLDQCEVPLCFAGRWHSGDAGICLWAVHGATGMRTFIVVALCAA